MRPRMIVRSASALEPRIVEERGPVRRRDRRARVVPELDEGVVRPDAARGGLDEQRGVDVARGETLGELGGRPRGREAQDAQDRAEAELVRRHRLEPGVRELLHLGGAGLEQLDQLVDGQVRRVGGGVLERERARLAGRRAQEAEHHLVEAEAAGAWTGAAPGSP